MPNERNIQNYHSTYNNIRDWLGYQKAGEEKAKSTIRNWDEVVFEVNFKHNKKTSEFLAALSKVSANLHK